MTRLLSATMWTAAILATIGALIESIPLFAGAGIAGCLAGIAWGYMTDASAERWRWDGERFAADPDNYRGEVSHDNGQTWEPDEYGSEVRRPMWDSEIGAPE